MRLPDSPYVDKFYQMNPETEGLTASMYLRDGMRILCGEPQARVNTDKEASWSKGETEMAKHRNLWFVVSRVYLTTEGEQATFVATYDDGTQRHLTCNTFDSWLVKLDSLDEVLHQARENARFEFWNALGRSVPPVLEVTPEDELMDEGGQPALWHDTSNAIGDGPKWPTDADVQGADETPSFDLSPVPNEESDLEQKGL